MRLNSVHLLKLFIVHPIILISHLKFPEALKYIYCYLIYWTHHYVFLHSQRVVFINKPIKPFNNSENLLK